VSDSKELVRRLRKVAENLRKAAVWNGSGLAVDATKDDYLYELLCYFQLAVLSASKFNVRIAGAVGTSKAGVSFAKWPKKSGYKTNFSYLSIEQAAGKAEIFQLCPGIRIRDIHGKNRAPDIILLSAGAPGRPTFQHVLACWDAKYTSRPESRLPDTAVSDFIFTFIQLGKPIPPPTWVGALGTPFCQKSGLLTNGDESTEFSSTLSAHGVSETHHYPFGKSITRP
jgi:hypothetical protein